MSNLEEIYQALSDVADSIEEDIAGKLKEALDDFDSAAGRIDNINQDISSTLSEASEGLRGCKDDADALLDRLKGVADTIRDWRFGV